MPTRCRCAPSAPRCWPRTSPTRARPATPHATSTSAPCCRNASDEENGELSLSDGQPLYRVPFHPSADGNTVEIGVEQAAFSQNASDFNTSLTFINMQLRGLAKAINGQ
jgi:flagellar basal-body rod protein FlgB